eukprot:a339737_17.p1 GENE.a339737_17~~a339737_17.p1  ORF type:complete len:361 (-),score=147.14 a339737_17:99-1043(-)
MAAIGDRLFVFGGRGFGKSSFNDLWVYDTARNRWSTPEAAGTAPSARERFCMCVAGTKIIIFGGWDSRRSLRLGDLHVLDTMTMEWRQPHTSGVAPTARRGAACAFYHGQMLVFGGDTGETLNDSFTLDPETWTWTQLNTSGYDPFEGEEEALISAGASFREIVEARLLSSHPIPCERTEGGAIAIDDTLYVLAGYSNRGAFLHDIHELRDSTWFARYYYGTHINGVRNFALAAIGPIVYLFGGENLGLEYTTSNTLYALNTETKTVWTMDSRGAVPTPRAGPMAAAVGERLFVFGGYAGACLDDLYVFDTTTA